MTFLYYIIYIDRYGTSVLEDNFVARIYTSYDSEGQFLGNGMLHYRLILLMYIYKFDGISIIYIFAYIFVTQHFIRYWTVMYTSWHMFTPQPQLSLNLTDWWKTTPLFPWWMSQMKTRMNARMTAKQGLCCDQVLLSLNIQVGKLNIFYQY